MTAFFMKINLPKQCLDIYDEILHTLGRENTFLVGGFVRDTLLGRESQDLDIATPLSYERLKNLFSDALCFAKFSTFTFKKADIHVTIASFRKEGAYLDHRHPSSITFVKELSEDAKRRDFTINCLYVDSTLEVLDSTGMGVSDIQNRVIRLIGDRNERISEDPLRILRALRFSEELGFTIEDETENALRQHISDIRYLNPQKVQEELHKLDDKARRNVLMRLKTDYDCDII
jgi:tRNA nucleotidyltransferase (CCA-adding enzyme)